MAKKAPLKHFTQAELEEFWGPEPRFMDRQRGPDLDDAELALTESILGYKLPEAYVELLRYRNGGYPSRSMAYPTTQPTSWANDEVRLTTLFPIGTQTDFSIAGECGTKFWCDEWGYPDIGIYFADTPTAGHNLFLLDYRDVAPDGEPRISWVDENCDYEIVEVAPDFVTFIRGLLEWEDDEEE